MTTITFKTKTEGKTKFVAAIDADGTIVAEWTKTNGASAWDAPTITATGAAEAVVSAVKTQLPAALVAAKWSAGRTAQSNFDFVAGLVDGSVPCWFGNTPAKVASAAAKARIGLTFKI